MKNAANVRPWADVAADLVAMAACGCRLDNACRLLALVVIPSLRISDFGGVDVDRFERTSVPLPG